MILWRVEANLNRNVRICFEKDDATTQIKQMIDEGRNLERNVLIDAIKAHLEHRIIIHGKRTIVFNR